MHPLCSVCFNKQRNTATLLTIMHQLFVCTGLFYFLFNWERTWWRNWRYWFLWCLPLYLQMIQPNASCLSRVNSLGLFSENSSNTHSFLLVTAIRRVQWRWGLGWRRVSLSDERWSGCNILQHCSFLQLFPFIPFSHCQDSRILNLLDSTEILLILRTL